MSFDFDNPPARGGTDSQKWQKYSGRDILPMWVADMDFRSSPAIIEALHHRVEHGIFGYARPVASTVEAVVNACRDRYGWQVDPSWLVWLPGLVCGLNVIANAFAAPGEEILSLSPVYPPFMTAPKNQGRVSLTVPLQLQAAGKNAEHRPAATSLARPAGRWMIDWDALEGTVTPRSKLFYLCHPHNPIARVWQRDELVRLAQFCARHNLILCSDEIHCDLVLDPDQPHLPAALARSGLGRSSVAGGGSAPGSIEPGLVTLMAPSKTYNIPGLGTSIAIISDPSLRARFERATSGIVAEVTTLGYAACEAAYRDSEPWRQALLAYLRANRDFLLDFTSRELPGVRIEAPIEATYLAWLNVEGLQHDRPASLFEAHGVGLSDGAMFGSPPGRHVRLNFGCPRSTLAEALNRMKKAVQSLEPVN